MAHTRRTRFEIGLLLLVGVLSAHQVLVAPIIGVADNGDYNRVLNPLGLDHVASSYADRFFFWVQPRYKAVARDTSMLVPSAELLLAGMALGIDEAVTRDGLFDLRVLGAVHLALYLVGVWLLLVAVRPLPGASRAVALGGVLLAAPDVAYVAYFNSFYSEPASLVFLLILLGVALRGVRAETPGTAAILAYFACAALVSNTKVQNYVLGVPLACLPLALLASRAWRQAWRLVVPLALALLLLAGYLVARVPEPLSVPARWNALFYGILVGSPSPEADLEEFGLEPELAKFAGGYGAVVDGVPVAAPYLDVTARYGLADVALFYARHPDRLVRVASACAQHSFRWREPLLGNYTKDSGRPGSAHAPSYTGWSDLEDRLLPKGLWFLAGYFVLFVGVAAWELRCGLDTPGGRTAALALTVAGLALVAFGVKVIAAGAADPVKHLFLFQVLFDISLFFGLAWLAPRCEPLLPWRVPARAAGAGDGPDRSRGAEVADRR